MKSYRNASRSLQKFLVSICVNHWQQNNGKKFKPRFTNTPSCYSALNHSRTKSISPSALVSVLSSRQRTITGRRKRDVYTRRWPISPTSETTAQFYRPTTSADSTAARMNSGTRTIPSNLCRRDVHCFSHEKCPSKAAIQNSPICVPLTTHSQKKRKSRLKTSSLNIASSIRAPCWDLTAIQTVPSRSYRPSRKS